MSLPPLDQRRRQYRCKRCRERWSQGRLGWCRRCEREVAESRDSVERARLALELKRRREAIETRRAEPPREKPTIVVDDVEYEVLNDAMGFGRAR
jgi:hypothetical protein